MTVAVRERPVILTPRGGGRTAQRAMRRWAWRLFRREWRQQLLVLLLLVVAVAGTVVGLGVASNADQLRHNPLFGTANTIIGLSGSDPQLAGDEAALQQRFGAVDVVAHQNIPVPGSVSNIDLRAEDPHGSLGDVTLRLDSGRFPVAPGEVAVTKDVATLMSLHLGSEWAAGGSTLRVVGVVENPLDLLDQFALVAPGQISAPDRVQVLLNAPPESLRSFRLPSGEPINVLSRGSNNKTAAVVIVLVLETMGLLFVGLMAVAGFTVMAHRRLRSIGMLGALGATDRNIRTTLLAGGAAVGATAAVVGTILGLVGWMAFIPTLESIAQHRIDRFALPWWAIGAAMVLSFLTAVLAAWWPARAMTRISVVAALSGRPPRPQPAHRFAVLGSVLLAAGIVLLAFADGGRAGFIIGGTVTTAVGLLLLSPLAIQVLGSAGRQATISVRLALRDLTRYQARSGAALGSITLAVGIAATIAVSAAGADSNSGPGNLPTNQMVLYAGSGGFDQVALLSSGQQQMLNGAAHSIASSLQANSVVQLDEVYDPRGDPVPAHEPGKFACAGSACAATGQPDGYPPAFLAQVTTRPHGIDITGGSTLYVATPEVLALYGISPNQIDPSADVVSYLKNLGSLQVFDPIFKQGRTPESGPDGSGIAHPDNQTFKSLPRYGSDPGTLITEKAVQQLGLQTMPAGWLIQTSHPLTATQIGTARQSAASAGLSMETHHAQRSLAPLRNWSTTAGILLALGVLAMTVGLIRSETANDLRTLTATGASSTIRRNVTASTAAGLAFLGALLGTAGAYAALLAWNRRDLHPLGHVPVVNLLLILVGFPLAAAVGGWLLAGREPPTISRRPLE